MPRTRSVLLPTALVVLGLGGCTSEKSTSPERLAVTPFENLSATREIDWLRKALPAAIVMDLSGLPKIYAQPVDSLDGAYAMSAARAVEGYFVQSNGRLQVHANVTDLASRKTVASFELDEPVSQGSIAVANEVAKKLSPEAHTFPGTNEGAFRAYGEALSGGDRESVLHALDNATRNDARFSLAYLEKAQILASGGDREGALRVVDQAKTAQPDEITGARLDLLAATLRSDSTAREQALEKLTRLTPADGQVFAELGQLLLAQRKFSEAVRSYQTSSGLNPADTQVWNELGYARAYAGDLAGASTALEEYQHLAPAENVNPLDSLGEVSFYLGDFHSAENYFLDADRKNASEFGGADLLKASQARLMTGDLAAADALFNKYAARAESSQRGRAAFQKAQWEFLTGRRRDAMEGLERMSSALDGDSKSLALAQLAVWRLQTGDRKAAEQSASQSAESAVGPVARNLSALCRALLNPGSETSGSRLADAYGRIFAKEFAEATPRLEALYHGTNPHADGEIRTLLAWAYVKTGRVNDAQNLVSIYPLPLSSGETLFDSLIFPRYLLVRGTVLLAQGKRAEAKAAYQLFLKYSGDVPDIFDDEAEARKALNGL